MKQTTFKLTQSWAELYAWQVDRTSAVPLFRQIYLQMRSAILSQRLRPGTKLPSTRDLARRLGVARASVVSAYEQLLAEGSVAGKVGAGTYISADLPQPIEIGTSKRDKNSSPEVQRLSGRARAFPHLAEAFAGNEDRPFSTGRSLVDARTVEVWRKLTQRAFRTFDPVHRGYSDVRGLPELRRVVCDYLRAARAVRCEPEQILITAGTQHAIDITIRVLLDAGDEVWVEDPGYPATSAALAAARVRLHPVPVDAHGMRVSVGIRRAAKARAAFVTPSHQFPLGVVLSMPRRIELLAWAREAGAWIVEDDYHSEFQYSGRPLASMQGLDDAARVIYVGTLNKVLFPGLRLGYAVVPPPLVRAFATARYLTDHQPPTLPQIIVTEFMREGHFAAHIRRMRLIYRHQRDVLAAELSRRLGDDIAIEVPDQGMHMVAYLGDGRADGAVEEAARASGVTARAISKMYRKAPARSGLMLGFSGYPPAMIVPAAAKLSRVIMHLDRARNAG